MFEPGPELAEMNETGESFMQWKSWLQAAAIVGLMIGIFVADTVTDLEIAAAVFYIVIILLAVGRFPRRNVIALAGLCILLTLVSSTLTAGGSREAGIVNMAISTSAIGITTWLALRMVAAEAAAHEARAQLVRIARVTSLGELTASIAHEVNQPLAGIVTSGNACLRWLGQDPPNIEKARASAERVLSDANRAGAVIQRVRSLARHESPKRDRTNLNEIIVEAVALAQAELDRHDIGMRLELAEALPPVQADRVQLQQVIGNLLLNAMEALAQVPQAERQIVIASTLEDRDVLISVADTGNGLAASTREHLFDAFWTTKEGGTGIGLTISRAIVEAHGGHIRADANSARGAIFKVRLPVAGAAR
ncbi:sensor histidine kinase [Sphingomonas kyeonggiensis]|uniref:histidine kinase n=1 Tax=Sphingomonas kyeonggiensis TaxID=1268553 RepID=A0A7W6NW91_9SPHN|nr:ATP-binding protein [Sphingomonas kyeonggiensis]MBB4097431.1 C4-dicarboxylate-specific signal transduction histidine kinase [Sphingomonas kyeonggiensis]